MQARTKADRARPARNLQRRTLSLPFRANAEQGWLLPRACARREANYSANVLPWPDLEWPAMHHDECSAVSRRPDEGRRFMSCRLHKRDGWRSERYPGTQKCTATPRPSVPSEPLRTGVPNCGGALQPYADRIRKPSCGRACGVPGGTPCSDLNLGGNQNYPHLSIGVRSLPPYG